MRTILLYLAVIILSTNSFAQTTPADTAQHPVYAYFMKGIDDFNQHHLDDFLGQFADDIHMYTHAGWLRDKGAVAQRFKGIFNQFPHIRMEVDSLHVRPVNAHTVLVDFRCRTFPQGKGHAFHTVGSGVYVWRTERWVEVFEHETLVKTDEGMFAR